MSKNIFFLAAISIVIALSGCKGPDKMAYYTAEYFVRYLEGEQIIKAESRIYAGPDAISVKPVPCEFMHFRDYEMTPNSKLGDIYQYEAAMPFAAKCSFEFQLTKDKKAETYAYELPQVPSFSVNDSLGLAKGVALTWAGAPLRQGESINLIFEKKDRSTAEATVTGPTAGNSLVIPLVQVKGISPGLWSVYLVRSSKTELVEEDHSITAEGAYYTKPIQVEL